MSAVNVTTGEILPTLDPKIELAFAQIEKQFGKGSIIRLGDGPKEPWPSISTGALTLDLALGIGGLPKGRIIEIFGPESAGKSTLALSVVKQCQQMGEFCLYVDAENALDPTYMMSVGVNLDELLLAQPSSGEDALAVVEIMVKTGAIGLIVVDSVAALVPQAELDGDMGQSHVGQQSRLMSQAMRKLTKVVAETNTCVIFINQIREKIGVMFGNPETQPGGRALKFYSSVRLDIRRKEDIKDAKTGEVIGIKSVVKVLKNKMAPPLKKCEIDIMYGKGISSNGCIADLAVEKGLIEKSGAWFKFNNEPIAQGRVNLVEYLAENEDFTAKLKEQIING